MKITITVTPGGPAIVVETPDHRTAWNPASLPAYDVPPVPLADAIDEAYEMDEDGCCRLCCDCAGCDVGD